MRNAHAHVVILIILLFNITGTVGNNCKILSDINIPMQLY